VIRGTSVSRGCRQSPARGARACGPSRSPRARRWSAGAAPAAASLLHASSSSSSPLRCDLALPHPHARVERDGGLVGKEQRGPTGQAERSAVLLRFGGWPPPAGCRARVVGSSVHACSAPPPPGGKKSRAVMDDEMGMGWGRKREYRTTLCPPPCPCRLPGDGERPR
jgi:hypothetical protein